MKRGWNVTRQIVWRQSEWFLVISGGFGMGGTGSMQMNAAQMQHQQLLRSQSGGMPGAGMTNSTQMQQLLSHQQQTLAMQQSNSQMSMQMQMSQTTSVNSVTNSGTGKISRYCCYTMK